MMENKQSHNTQNPANNAEFQWLKSINAAITVTDLNDNIVFLNEKSKIVNKANIGDNIVPCHKPETNVIIKKLKETNGSNTYTIEKFNDDGTPVNKFIHQTPWYDENGNVAGLVELSIEIPPLKNIPHKVREKLPPNFPMITQNDKR